MSDKPFDYRSAVRRFFFYCALAGAGHLMLNPSKFAAVVGFLLCVVGVVVATVIGLALILVSSDSESATVEDATIR